MELIADEVNVKSVILVDTEDHFASRTLTVVFKVAAPRLGPRTPAAAAAAKSGDWELLDGGRARCGDNVLEPGEFEMRVQPLDESTTRALGGTLGLVVLDIVPTDELRREGLARDLVRAVQQRRRELGLDVTDRIRLEVSGDPPVLAAVDAHGKWIAEQVLAREILVVAEPIAGASAGEGWHPVGLADQAQARILVTRADAN